MHKTSSIDYGIIIEGEVELELDGGDKRLMKPRWVPYPISILHSIVD
jgi:hypothetical protein